MASAAANLSRSQISELTDLINPLPSHSDLLTEVKTSLLESIALDKPLAINHLRIRLEPAILVNDDIATKRDIYRAILRVLDKLGLPSQLQPGISIVETTIDTLFPVDEFQDVNDRAKQLYEAHVDGRSNGSTRPDRPQVVYNSQDVRSSASRTNEYSTEQGSAFEPDSRKLSNASYTFRDSTHRFSGNYDCPVSLYRFRQMVFATCDKYSVPERSRVSILTDALEGQALDYYLDNIAGQVDSLATAFQLLERRFDSPHSRAQAQSYLESLSLSSIRDSQQCSTAQALDIAIKKISSVVPMCGPAFSHESHKSRWLANMLRNEDWAQQCCANRMTMAQDYKTFVASLHSALTQLSIANGATTAATQNSSQLIVPTPTYFGRRYALPTRQFRRVNKPRRTPEQLRRLKETTRCLKCGQKGHWRAECPQRHISMTDAINARMRANGTNMTSVHDTLIALVKDEDEYANFLTSMPRSPTTHFDVPDKGWRAHSIDPTPFDTLMAQLDTEQETDDPTQTVIEEDETSDTKDIHFLSNPTSTQFDINFIFTVNRDQTDVPPFIVPHISRSTDPFLGGLIDTGAQKSVIGMPQAIAYFKRSGKSPLLHKSSHFFRFGRCTLKATHSFLIDIPTPNSTITIEPDVVPADIPFLIGLDAMREHKLQPLVIQQELESVEFGWRLPLTFHQGHLYLRWFDKPSINQMDPNNAANTSIGTHFITSAWHSEHETNPRPTYTQRMTVENLLNPSKGSASQDLPTTQERTPTSRVAPNTERAYTHAELSRIHRHFSHASARKLYDLLCRASRSTPPNTLQQLEAVVSACRTCLEFTPRPISFRVREADSTLFNHRLTLDLVWLPAKNPPRPKANRPALHIVDVGTRFNAAIFLNGESSTEVWNSFLRAWSCMYVGMPSSILVDQGSVFISDEWRYACELNQIELVPTGTGSHNSLGAGEAYHAYLRRLYNKIHTDFPRIQDEVALAIAIKAINDTTGPKGLCPTLLVFGILPQLPTPSRRDHPSQSDRFRAAALARKEYERIVHAERLRIAIRKQPPRAADTTFMTGDMVYVYREAANRFTGPHMVASIHGKRARVHVGEKTGPREFNIAHLRPSPLPNASIENLKPPRYPPTILHTEILAQGDKRERWFDEEKRKELLGLLERGAFKICLREDAGDNPNIVPTRYVLAIKHSQTDEPPRLKARFVIGGHKDKDKNLLLHDTRTVRPESIRLIIALATIFGLKLSVADWRQGYVQSKSTLLRKVFIRPKELELKANELVQVLRPVYGLADAGDYWADTLSQHLHQHLSFTQATTDMALWLRIIGSKLVAMAACYVDDVLLATTPEALKQFSNISKQRFDVEINSSDVLSYVGLRISISPHGVRIVSQPKQISRLKLLPTTCSFEEYRSARACLAWLMQTRPDVACAISMAARVTRNTFDSKAILAHNAVVRYLRSTMDRALKFPKLDGDSLRIACYVDAGHCNAAEGRSQLGYIITLADKNNNCCVLAFSSKRSRRIVRSTTAGEGLAFADGFDMSYTMREDMQQAVGKQIPIVMITDSQILFNIITRRRTTTERRMMIDLKAARDAYAKREISNIALISSEHNPADALTKIKSNHSLNKLIDSARIDHPIVQFVIEPRAPAYVAGSHISERLRTQEKRGCVRATS